MSQQYKRETLWRSPNGLWAIERVTFWDTTSEYINVHNGVNSQQPIRYASGAVAWDNPYQIPAYVKRATERILATLEKERTR